MKALIVLSLLVASLSLEKISYAFLLDSVVHNVQPAGKVYKTETLSRVYGEKNFPAVASIELLFKEKGSKVVSDIKRCTGTLFKEGTIVTAAHCFFQEKGLQLASVQISFEANPILTDRRIFPTSYAIHPRYTGIGAEKRDAKSIDRGVDVAVLRFDPATGPKVVPQPLVDLNTMDRASKIFAVVGYGDHAIKGDTFWNMTKALGGIRRFAYTLADHVEEGVGAPSFGREAYVAVPVKVLSLSKNMTTQPSLLESFKVEGIPLPANFYGGWGFTGDSGGPLFYIDSSTPQSPYKLIGIYGTTAYFKMGDEKNEVSFANNWTFLNQDLQEWINLPKVDGEQLVPNSPEDVASASKHRAKTYEVRFGL